LGGNAVSEGVGKREGKYPQTCNTFQREGSGTSQRGYTRNIRCKEIKERGARLPSSLGAPKKGKNGAARSGNGRKGRICFDVVGSSYKLEGPTGTKGRKKSMRRKERKVKGTGLFQKKEEQKKLRAEFWGRGGIEFRYKTTTRDSAGKP